jgi:uncharacterized protein (DUF1697 family)
MPRYVALLRAINVGGHTVKMIDLRRHFESLGLTRVSTFIASGNVIFESKARAVDALERRIERHLEAVLGYEVGTFIRTPQELAAVAAHPAFPPSHLQHPGASLYVMFLGSPIEARAARAVEGLRTALDEFHVHGREIYWFARGMLTESLVNGTELSKAIGVPTTMRNMNTVRKLAALAGNRS